MPSPNLFFDTAQGYQRSAAIKAAIELDIFSPIGAGKTTPDAIAESCGAAVRGVRILCDYLTVIGFLTKSDGRYGLTIDTATFLDRNSPAYLGKAVDFLCSSIFAEHFLADPTALVRKGGTVTGQGSVAPDHPIWVEFARAMAPLMAMPAERLAALLGGVGASLKVLDVAAGHGLFGIAMARQNPHAEITALDWGAVLAVAQENAAAAGVAARYRTLAGSAFDVDFGGPYDLVLLTNFLHHFDAATCETLLRKTHAALAPGGRAAALEFIPNEDRVSPPVAAKFAFTMLGSTPAGDAFTFAEYRQMFGNAGFSDIALHDLPPTEQRVVTARR
jgi:ubiquinone/menaquinone biosynthesis C-methylase UbiE